MNKEDLSVVIKHKIKPYKKKINVDSDKSLSIRSFLIGSICQGVSTAKNVLESDDVKDTISVCKKLGVKIKKVNPKVYKIFGRGLGSFSIKKNSELNFSIEIKLITKFVKTFKIYFVLIFLKRCKS